MSFLLRCELKRSGFPRSILKSPFKINQSILSSRHYSQEDKGFNLTEKFKKFADQSKSTTRNNLRNQYYEHYYQQYYQTLKFQRNKLYKKYFSWTATAILLWILLSAIFYKDIKEFIAKTIGNYITKNSRFTVVFEEASILPGWNKLYFKKCFISRRPKIIKEFVKGNQKAAIDSAGKNINEEVYDDGNYTQYDLTVNEINMSISFTKWLNGKGILKDVEFKGVRGIIDRTHVSWDPNDDARNYLNLPQPGDFHVENYTIEDLLITLYQPGGFRPFNISIFDCELSKLRQNWLFMDFLTANHINGAYDGSLFTINKFIDTKTGEAFTRCRIDGLNVDHLNSGVDGPLGWIVKGSVNMIGDIKIPNNNFKVEEFLSTIKNEVFKKLNNSHIDEQKFIEEQYLREYKSYYNEDDKFTLDLYFQMNNVKAAIPHGDISYINYALMSPIVGYINSRQTFVGVNCKIVKSMKDFNGSWTVYDCLLMDDISKEIYTEFENYVINEKENSKRMKKIGFWTLQLVLQVVLFGLSSIG